jgi:hypothetical protein
MDLQIGGAVGIAIFTSVYAFVSSPSDYVSGLSAAFGCGAILSLVATSIACLAARRGKERNLDPE